MAASTELSAHSAAPQAGGYYFQLERALYRLALHPTSERIGVETLDDVSVHDADGRLLCEQDKATTIEASQPFGDRRKGLWNALMIWADAVASRELDPTRCEFHLVTNGQLGDGLAFKISKINSDATAAQEVVTALRAYAPSLPASVKSVADQLLRHGDSVLHSVLVNVRCYSMADGVSGDELRAQIAAHLRVPPKLNEQSIVDTLLGWLHRQVITRIFSREPAWIKVDAFNTQLQAVIDIHRQTRYREWPVTRLIVTDAEREDSQGRVFVEQLALIGAEDDEVVDAIDDFIRFGRERLRLSHEGEIPDEEWSHFDTRLIEHWKPVHRAHRLAPAADDAIAGRLVYVEIQRHREILGGCQTSEYYFTRGAYHSLADRLLVGWHPKFRDRLGPRRASP